MGPDEQQPQWLVRQFAAGERLPLAFFLSSGLLEEPEADGILGSNRSLRAALQGKGYPLHYREFPGGHDYAAWSWRGDLFVTGDQGAAGREAWSCAGSGILVRPGQQNAQDWSGVGKF